MFAEAYDADARDFGVSAPHYSLAAWINWNINFDDPTRVTASLLPEPACNAMQEFVCASELIELGFPASSSSVVEPAGELVSISASMLADHRNHLASPSSLILGTGDTRMADHRNHLASPSGLISANSRMADHKEFVCASELIELGYPASSSSVVAPAGDLVSISASSHLT